MNSIDPQKFSETTTNALSDQIATSNSRDALVTGLTPPRRTLPETLLLASLGIVLAISLIEVAVRYVTPKEATHTHEVLQRKWYLPNSSTDNRDFHYNAVKSDGVFRIVVVGDTITFAQSLHFDDTFPKRLERMLNLNSVNGHKVEVLNWGVPNFSTSREVRLVEHAISHYSADLVILQMSLNDAEQRPYRVAHIWADKRSDSFFDLPILRHWKTLPFLFGRLRNLMLSREYVAYINSLYTQTGNWVAFSDSIKSMATLSAKFKVPVLAVLFPLISTADSEYPFQAVHKKVDALLTQSHFAVLDLLQRFTSTPAHQIMTEFDEGELPNEIAHRIAADAIYEKLEDERLIPAWAVIQKVRSRPRILLSIIPEDDQDFQPSIAPPE